MVEATTDPLLRFLRCRNVLSGRSECLGKRTDRGGMVGRWELSFGWKRTAGKPARLVAPLPRSLVRFLLVDQSPRSYIVPLFLLSGVISPQWRTHFTSRTILLFFFFFSILCKLCLNILVYYIFDYTFTK